MGNPLLGSIKGISAASANPRKIFRNAPAVRLSTRLRPGNLGMWGQTWDGRDMGPHGTQNRLELV
jgi:hypothetical protein